MTIADLVTRYNEARRIDKVYAMTLLRRATALAKFAGTDVVAEVFDYDVLNGFLHSVSERVGEWTLKGYRGDLLTLWNFAADAALVDYPIARRIYRIRIPRLLIDCYSTEEVKALLCAAEKLTGHYPNRTSKADYWGAVIRFAWDTGLRRGDVWTFERAILRPDSRFRIVQSKTGTMVRHTLRPKTVEAMMRIGAARPFQWHLATSRFGRHFKRIVTASGVHRGSFKWLRRASGSYVEALQPGAGHKHLGHTSSTTFTKHYDANLGVWDAPLPPELD